MIKKSTSFSEKKKRKQISVLTEITEISEITARTDGRAWMTRMLFAAYFAAFYCLYRVDYIDVV